MKVLREEFSKRCLIVKGILPGTDPQIVNNIFKGQGRRLQHKEGTMWLILFHSSQRTFLPIELILFFNILRYYKTCMLII